ncbi:MAG: hypothetical protein IJ647_10370 [Prevotella sp.]|nr:hypothetical protein [Prevotella sp.]
MKKFYYTIGIIATTALVFTACQKEQATKDELPTGKLVTISFSAEKVGVDTKTAAVEGATDVSYIWTAEDIANIKLFTVEDGSLASEVDSPVITKVSDTKLTISATVAANATYTFRAILCDPSSYTGNSENPYTSRKPKIKTSQSPNGTTNFDPTADILVSDDKEVTVGEETTTGDMLLSFRRQVVVNKMTLKNLVEGEKVSKVVVKSDKYLTGYLNDGSMSGQSKELTLNYSDVAVPASGQFVVYFITMANAGQTLTVEVTTDQNTYSKDFTKTIDFNLGEFTKFGVSLPAGTPISDLSGYYLIGYKPDTGDWVLMNSDPGSSTFYPKFDTSVSTAFASIDFDTDFAGIANISDCIWKVEAYDGAYSIKSMKTGEYLALTSDGNAAHHSETLSANTKFAVSVNGKDATIQSSTYTERVLRYNSGSPRFAFYKGTQNGISMIPATYDDRTPVTLSFTKDAVEYDTDDYGDFSGQDVTASPNVAAITDNIDWSYVDTDGIIKEFIDGALELNGNTGSATVTASFAGDATYRSAVVSYIITVSTAGTTTYYYEEMTSAPADWTAETFIIISGTSVLNTSATSSWGGFTAVTKEADGSVKSTAALELLEVTATGNSTDGYKLCFTNAADAYYLNPLTSKNFALSTTSSGTLDLAVDKIANHSNSSWLLRLNGASGYRWYSSATGTAAVLYKKVAK